MFKSIPNLQLVSEGSSGCCKPFDKVNTRMIGTKKDLEWFPNALVNSLRINISCKNTMMIIAQSAAITIRVNVLGKKFKRARIHHDVDFRDAPRGSNMPLLRLRRFRH